MLFSDKKNTLRLTTSSEETVNTINLNVQFHILRNTEHTFFFSILATDLQSMTRETSVAAPAAGTRGGGGASPVFNPGERGS